MMSTTVFHVMAKEAAAYQRVFSASRRMSGARPTLPPPPRPPPSQKRCVCGSPLLTGMFGLVMHMRGTQQIACLQKPSLPISSRVDASFVRLL